MGQPDEMTLPQWLSAAVLDQRQRAEFLRTLAAAMPDGQALLDLAEWIDRDVDAKWAILELHIGEHDCPGPWVGYCDDPNEPCPTVRHLATMYADRDGWREEWRPA